MDTDKIGRFIAENRKKHNLTQAQLAAKLGVTGKTVSRWENGNYMPDLSLLQPLAQELEVTLNELLRGEYIQTENISEKSDNTLKSTVNYSAEKIKKERSVRQRLYIIAVVRIYLALWLKYTYDDLYLTFRTADECRNFVYAEMGYEKNEARIHSAVRRYSDKEYVICFFVSDSDLTVFVIEEYRNRYRTANSGVYVYSLEDLHDETFPSHLYTLYDEENGYENDLHVMWGATYDDITEVRVKDRSMRPVNDESGLKIWFTSTNTYWDMNNVEYIYR